MGPIMMLQTNRAAPYLAGMWGTETCSLSPFVADWINKETNERERSELPNLSFLFLSSPMLISFMLLYLNCSEANCCTHTYTAKHAFTAQQTGNFKTIRWHKWSTVITSGISTTIYLDTFFTLYAYVHLFSVSATLSHLHLSCSLCISSLIAYKSVWRCLLSWHVIQIFLSERRKAERW